MVHCVHVSLLRSCSHKARLVTMIHNIKIQYKILLIWNTYTNAVCENYITRNSSADAIANVNFMYDDIVHVLQNTIGSCINSATDRRGYVLERMFTKFSEVTQYNVHYVVQGHSRSPILVPIESSYTTSY